MESVLEKSRRVLKVARSESSARQRAWILRGEIDTTMVSLEAVK